MNSAKLALRAPSTLRPRPVLSASRICRLRFQSRTAAASSASPSAVANGGARAGSHLAAGAIGGVVAAAILYTSYLLTPSGQMSRTINRTAQEVHKKYKEASQKLQQTTPNADQAIDSVKQFCYSYVTWVPGGRRYVDTVFRDLDKVRENHRDEADQIINDAQRKLRDLGKSGLSLETASKAYEVLVDLSQDIASLAGDALDDILDNHPDLKSKVGKSAEQLKHMGEQFGPEAKKQVDETWQQVRDILKDGISQSSIEDARKLMEDKIQQVEKFGDDVWSRAVDQIRPYLTKNPKVKELVEKNSKVLKQGNLRELYEAVKNAVDSGETEGLEEYVSQQIGKAQSTASKWGNKLDGLEDSIPKGTEIISKLQQLKEVTDKHAEEGKKLFEDTIEEIKAVLDKQGKKANDIVSQIKHESK